MPEVKNEFKVNVEVIRKIAIDFLTSAGLSDENAWIVADSLVQADLRGIDSHGVARLPIYLKRLKTGVVNAKPEIRVIKERPSVVVIDGDNGMGHVVGVRAMDLCVARAKENGLGAAGVRNTNHFGIAAYYAMKALDSDMIGLAMTNAPSSMAPWGGTKPYFGTNPFAVAVPAGEELPVVLDMSTSIVAKGKIILAARKGEKIGLGWAIDSNGDLTTDAKEALLGSVLPLGGAKGYGLALIVDILSSILTGALFGSHVRSLYDEFSEPQGLGNFMMAINVAEFMLVDEFKRRMDEMIKEVKNCSPALNAEQIYLPGEIEFMRKKERTRNGIPLSTEVADDLVNLGRELGISINFN